MKKWAILIGVDQYFGLEEDLPRARNDVRIVKDLLLQKFGFEIQYMLDMLVSQDSSPEASFGGAITERIPTYDNIINAFRKLEELCSPGDLVYFHFSGVLIEAPSLLPEFAAFPTFYRDLAFVPTDYRDQGKMRLLHDLELSTLLHRLVQRDVEVVAILDCRHMLEEMEEEVSDHRNAPCPAGRSTSPQDLREMAFVDTKWSYRLPAVWMYDPNPAETFSMITSFNTVSGDKTSRAVKVRQGWGWMTIYERENPSGMEDGILTEFMTKVLQDNEGYINIRELHHLILQEATRDTVLNRNEISLTGNGLRLFPGSWKDKDHGNLAPVPAPTHTISTLPAPRTSPVQRHFREDMSKQSKEERQAEHFHPASPTARSLETSLEAPAQAYRRLIRLGGADQESSPYIHVEISGGYRYEDTTSAPYPDYGDDGSFHALSGDHIVLLIRNLSDRDLFLRIIHFGCDYSVQTVYPDIELVQEKPTFRPRDPNSQTELLLHFRVGSQASCVKRDQLKTHLYECFKIVVSDQPISFECLESLPGTTNECQQKPLDPVMWALAEEALNGPGEYNNADHDDLDTTLAFNSLQIGSSGEAISTSTGGAWSCRNVLYAIHTDPDSLRRAVRT